MVNILDLTVGFLLVSGLVSLVLLVLALNAYRKRPRAHLVYLAIAFAVFMIKNFLVGYSILTNLIPHNHLELVDAVGDLATVLLIIVPVFFQRPGP